MWNEGNSRQHYDGDGTIRIEQGRPVIYGIDTMPLAVSDRGFDGLRNDRRASVATSGFASLALRTGIATLWLVSSHPDRGVSRR
ncbi:hypothetical protein C477_09279 [Haloterrigena salina JCM 13891]|uniref:Uncharacterized protein n=1 Tax=Haloterrigena salina JCM 13891 TaxID=1227488 RepID=M0C7H9_9EURY|nr:hypothetical protein C477_09279 [Haloterrigena salina JCM 13891]